MPYFLSTSSPESGSGFSRLDRASASALSFAARSASLSKRENVFSEDTFCTFDTDFLLLFHTACVFSHTLQAYSSHWFLPQFLPQ